MRALALTVGDPAGVGPEVTVAALGRFLARVATPPPIHLICTSELLERSLHLLESNGMGVEATGVRAGLGSTVQLESVAARPARSQGQWDPANCPFIAAGLERGIALAEAGAALVTGPTDKRFFVAAGLAHAGHTEYLATRYPGHEPLMLFEAGGFRIAVLTRHIPLASVTAAVRRETLVRGAATAWGYVTRQDGAPRPMAVAALDPHCGEWGAFSSVDLEVRDWVGALSGEGVLVEGPLAADTLFVPSRLPQYSAILCWYHDQGMIPIKLLRFDSAVNVTLGLPILRVSPAHGVAYDIAWRGRADAGSYLAAMLAGAGLSDPSVTR